MRSDGMGCDAVWLADSRNDIWIELFPQVNRTQFGGDPSPVKEGGGFLQQISLVFPSTNGRVLLSKGRYPVAAVNLRLSEIKICSSKPYLWPHL